MGTLKKHPGIQGRKTIVRSALARRGDRSTVFEPEVITLGEAATKSATSLTISPGLVNPIAAGQWLMFTDATGKERLAKVTVNAEVGATSLTVAALPEAIADDSTAGFPVELFDRTAADLSQSFNLAEIATFNTGGSRDGVITGDSTDISLPGLYYAYNAALMTIRDAARGGSEIYLEVEYDKPSDAYSRGEVTYGYLLVTGYNQASPVDGFISADIDGALVSVDTKPPKPVA